MLWTYTSFINDLFTADKTKTRVDNVQLLLFTLQGACKEVYQGNSGVASSFELFPLFEWEIREILYQISIRVFSALTCEKLKSFNRLSLFLSGRTTESNLMRSIVIYWWETCDVFWIRNGIAIRDYLSDLASKSNYHFSRAASKNPIEILTVVCGELIVLIPPLLLFRAFLSCLRCVE